MFLTDQQKVEITTLSFFSAFSTWPFLGTVVKNAWAPELRAGLKNIILSLFMIVFLTSVIHFLFLLMVQTFVNMKSWKKW